jgi:hypothetical protein
MPRVAGFLRILSRRDRWGRPVDPDYGIDEGVDPDYGVDEGGHPDQGLPGRPPGFWGGERPGMPERPGHLPSYPGRPVDPDYGIDVGPPGFWGGERPPQRPPHVWPRPPSGGLPVDPGWGVGTRPPRPDHGLPIWPVVPGKPDNSLPPVEGVEPPPTDPPPGTIWPPLPPSVPPGKAIVLVAISGVGYRYAVITIPPVKPDQGLPGGGAHPDQGLPPTAQPKR